MFFDLGKALWYFWFVFIVIILFASFFIWMSLFFNEKYQIKIITKKIRRYFSFLLDYGFQIHEVNYQPQHNNAWTVILETKDCKILISQERGDIYCGISSVHIIDEQYSDLFPLITLVDPTFKGIDYTRARNIDARLKIHSNLLKSHYNQIIALLKSYPNSLYKTLE